ncbi:MAG: hypothetical protein HZC36_12985 [Armatimonadetes bacterium]|nr:hypothetical protein [Armatimonadota bacterium]
MDIRFSSEDLDPHEYEGLVFNLPAKDIPIHIAREISRVGSMELWEYQHFVHHDHPFHDPDDALAGEPVLAEQWANVLNARFPEFRFVVEVSPVDRITWYQATDTAPTEDDPEFSDYSPPVSFQVSEFVGMLKEAREAEDFVGALGRLNRESFRAQTSREGSAGNCEHCEASSGFTEAAISPQHRGMRVMACLSCGKQVVHSTRIIRYKVGF